MKTPALLRSFNSRNYRLFFGGQAVMLTGLWMSITASMWLAFRLTGDAFHVGLLGFASQIPLLVLTPFTSVVGDRVDRRKLLIGLQVFSLLQIGALAVLTLTGRVNIGLMVALALLQGIINAFEFPVRQSFVVEMVDDRADLPNALALNASVFNMTRLAGPALAGVFIELWGEGVCFALNAASYAAIIASLRMMRVRPAPRPAARARPWADFREGVSHAAGEGRLRRPLLLVAVVALAGFAAHTLAAVIAKDTFGGGARLLGHFYSVVGAGALLAAIFLGGRATTRGLRGWITTGAFLAAAGTLAVALARTLWLAFAGYFVTGIAVVLVLVGCNTLIQARVEDDKRTRVMGLFVTATGLAPVGQLLAGAMASRWGPGWALALCAATLLAAALAFARPRTPPTVAPAPPPDPPALPGI
ncbi:MAG: MFS transporter [Opitutaceae bacterium]|nr:MFS transporter [Opitutaceae bacterium]